MNIQFRPVIICLLLIVTPAFTQDADTRLVRETEALSAAEEQTRLKVPEGFEVQLFASEPMINKPINIAFDDRGRLWVSSTVEYPYAADRERWTDDEGSQVRDSRDAIKILEDTDGDGTADVVIDFADGLNIPTGVLPWHRSEHKEGCIAWSIPNIWYFADTTGDGKCDHREVLFGPLGFEKDTHGMCSSFRLGPDGWVYGTHGFNNTSHFRVREKNLKGAKAGDPGTELDLHSGNVYRFRPDGSRIEIWSWGQVNPFGLAFDRRGNLYSADCHSAPIYQLLRGAHYPSFGKPHDGLGFGPTMIEHKHGSSGICGITYVDGNIWGETWNDRIFIGNVVTSRVNHDRIEWRGSTPVAIEEPDFVVSDDPWFRPVDLRIGPDGALYVADFYNRIIGHYEVPLEHPGRDHERGRIWRITKTEGEMGPPSSPQPLKIDFPLQSLSRNSPFERRAAASVLQDAPEFAAIPKLLSCLNEAPEEDTHLRHALKLSLRAQLSLPGGFDILSAQGDIGPGFAEVALGVPTASASGYLMGQLKTKSLKSKENRLAALTHIGRYGKDKLTGAVIEWATQPLESTDVSRQTGVLSALYEGRLERNGQILNPEITAWGMELANAMLLEEKARGGKSDWTDTRHPDHPKSESPWVLQPRKCADGIDAVVLSSLPRGGRNAEQRTGVLKSREFAAPKSLSFWICGHRGYPDQSAHELNRVRLVNTGTGAELFHAFPPRSDEARQVTWNLAEHAGEKVRLEVIDGDSGKAFAWLGMTRIEPAGKAVSTAAFGESEARRQALRTLAEILSHVAPIDLRDQLSSWLPPRPSPQPIAVSPERRKELDRLIQAREKAFAADLADAGKGRELFVTHCAVCHQIGGEGGLIGPQLDGVGKRGVARLCEDILDPNRNVDAHFHLHSFTKTDGSVAGGFVRSETDRLVRLIDTAGQEYRLLRSEIAESQVSPLSLMPPNFAELLSEAEFSDLLSFLSGQ